MSYLKRINLSDWSPEETVQTINFPETMQHNLVLKFYTHYLEEDKVPIELKRHAQYVKLPH